MKLLVFAHTPPPHHGQSYMVKLMLDGLGGDWRKKSVSERAAREADADPNEIHCYHVNARFSEDLEDVGVFRPSKVWLVMRYCAEAIWCRFRYGIHAFYYVPAPGKRAALYRDWIVMLLCRPFFRRSIYHWHAVGLGDWLQTEASWFERKATRCLLGRPALGLALAIPGMRDALWFRSRHVEVVPNGIPDPCPDFDADVLPQRVMRLHARQARVSEQSVSADGTAGGDSDPVVFRILFLAHCTREKGLFDTVQGVLLADSRLRAANSPIQIHLTVAGKFLNESEEQEFRALLSAQSRPGLISCAGFVSGTEKSDLMRGSDCLCFPTYYSAEGQPVNLIEAMAFGLPVVTTRWRSIPELLPPDYSRFVSLRSPEEVAEALIATAGDHTFESLRARFLSTYTEARHVGFLSAALKSAKAFR